MSWMYVLFVSYVLCQSGSFSHIVFSISGYILCVVVYCSMVLLAIEEIKYKVVTYNAFSLQVFRKYGIEKYDPTNEAFDPNRHNAVFSLQDASKPPGTVAVVLKVQNI